MSDSLRGINGAKLIIDVGLPILSMHSIRGIAGYKDPGIGVRFFKEVLKLGKRLLMKWRMVSRSVCMIYFAAI